MTDQVPLISSSDATAQHTLLHAIGDTFAFMTKRYIMAMHECPHDCSLKLQKLQLQKTAIAATEAET